MPAKRLTAVRHPAGVILRNAAAEQSESCPESDDYCPISEWLGFPNIQADQDYVFVKRGRWHAGELAIFRTANRGGGRPTSKSSDLEQCLIKNQAVSRSVAAAWVWLRVGAFPTPVRRCTPAARPEHPQCLRGRGRRERCAGLHRGRAGRVLDSALDQRRAR